MSTSVESSGQSSQRSSGQDEYLGDNEPLLHSDSATVDAKDVEGETMPGKASHRQQLSWGSAYVIITSRMLGSGIWAVPGVVARSAGSIGLSLCVWLLGALIALCGSAVLLEYGCMLTYSGGDKVYLEFTYRRPRYLVPTIVATKAILQAFTANNCILFREYLVHGLSIAPTPLAQKVSALGLLFSIVGLHGFFPKLGILVQNTLGWLKLGLILFTMAIGVFFATLRPHAPSPSLPYVHSIYAWDTIWTGSNWSLEVVALTLFQVQYAYAGIENANNVLSKVRDPIAMLKRIVPLSLVSICILYLFLNVSVFLVLPMDEIKQNGEMAAAHFFTRILGDGGGASVLPLLIAIAVAGNVMVSIFGLSRVNQEIARSGLFPLRFASSRPCNAPLG